MADGDAARAPPAAAAPSLVESFCAVTSATPQEAAFFLESHNWALESAVRSFYDSAEGGADADAADPVAPPISTTSAGDGAESEDDDYVGGGAGDDEEEDEDYVGDDDGDDEDAAISATSAAAAAAERRRPLKRLKKSHDARGGSGSASRPRAASGRGNVRTFSDLGGSKRNEGSDEDSDEDDEWAPPPELCTGSEKRDRSKRKNNADEVFKQAKKKGAKQGPCESRRRSSRSFSGTGRLLTNGTIQPDAPHPPEDIVYNICFWSNGFTVNSGPLRSFDDPENALFLESIKNSECPTELEPADGKSKVNVNLVRKEEECPVPVKRDTFQGKQRTLGTTPDTTSVGAASNMMTATKTVKVNDSLPSTSLKIRFADGSLLVARFNTSHTIGDVRTFIDSTRPEASEYTLHAGFPPKVLDDANKTIEEADVANSVIIQKV